MLNDVEARIFGRRPGRLVGVARMAGVYLLIALALVAELLFVLVHPEDDPVMLIGLVLLTIAVAIWLRFLFLVPAVILIWFIPASVRDAVRDDSLTWSHAATLAAQLYLAGATRFTYKALRARLLTPRPVGLLPEPAPVPAPEPAPVEPVVATEPPANETVTETPAVPRKPAMPCGRILAPAEAASLIDRLLRLDRDLRLSRESIRAALEGGLTPSADQRESAASR
jgi:hypothetical protein